eukprot:CAMPEP_0174297488 /NCGR_PEP_ID=MMETSP0809-20121228/51160_1 /TAXON_ID=73025 ORGANISM="Eutreptiella gymnastica-like, Strain CCMP1594" /NCGR_SAMPLE_ID=MMETSP0809 /ASSEMBLY_ACC=CAM_ASM_000658 /LENGTH=78 /DNA_ID=CAMNT_0015401301 /DNA_START=430 /DNA_END=666 /DNA_ORIENTATION=+
MERYKADQAPLQHLHRATAMSLQTEVQKSPWHSTRQKPHHTPSLRAPGPEDQKEGRTSTFSKNKQKRGVSMASTRDCP